MLYITQILHITNVKQMVRNVKMDRSQIVVARSTFTR